MSASGGTWQKSPGWYNLRCYSPIDVRFMHRDAVSTLNRVARSVLEDPVRRFQLSLIEAEPPENVYTLEREYPPER